jgi:hypothetical protein
MDARAPATLADESVYAPPAAARPPGRAKPAASAPHVVTRQEAQAAKVALARLERLGKTITKALITIGLGALVFTMANVMLFAISRGIPGWIAWMLDPLASLALLTVLYVEGVLTELGGRRSGGWPGALRWFAGTATWLMNSWTSWFPDGRFHLIPQHPDAGGLLLHSVAPMLLIFLAEASSGYRRYLAGRLAELRETLQVFDDQEQAARDARDREIRERREREENERREAERAEREAARERERAEREARQREIEAKAEIEKLHAQRSLMEREAQLDAERAERERENEAARAQAEAEIERARAEAEAAREAEIIKAQGEAEAARLLAEEQVRAREEERRLQREREEREAEERRLRNEQRARERQARAASRTSEVSSRIASGPASISGGSTSQNGALPSQTGQSVPREVRSELREQAEREVARRLLDGGAITPADQAALAVRYGRKETWVGDRIRSARQRLTDDPDFELAVIASALEDAEPVSQKTRDSEPEEQHQRA